MMELGPLRVVRFRPTAPREIAQFLQRSPGDDSDQGERGSGLRLSLWQSCWVGWGGDDGVRDKSLSTSRWPALNGRGLAQGTAWKLGSIRGWFLNSVTQMPGS